MSKTLSQFKQNLPEKDEHKSSKEYKKLSPQMRKAIDAIFKEMDSKPSDFLNTFAHYVFNNGSKQAVTIRNAADDGDTGSIRINANAGVVISTDIGVGFRGATSLFITPIVSVGF